VAMVEQFGGMIALGVTLAVLIACHVWAIRRPQLDVFGFSRFDCEEVGNKHDAGKDGKCTFCGKILINPLPRPLPRK